MRLKGILFQNLRFACKKSFTVIGRSFLSIHCVVYGKERRMAARRNEA